MKALILGGCGFIGSHIVDALLAAGHRVSVLDRSPLRPECSWADVSHFQGDIGDPNVLIEALAGVDIVYHLASATLPGTSDIDSATDIESNLIRLTQLLDLMRTSGCRRIVYFSSGGTVYGETRADKVDEDHPLRPICTYGSAKVAIETYLGTHARLYGLQPVILRTANAYGPRQGKTGLQGLIGTCLYKILHREPLEIWGDDQTVRDYVHVEDIARLARMVGESNKHSGIFNVGSGQGTSIRALIDLATMVSGRQLSIRHHPSRSFDVRYIVLSVDRVKDAFGWCHSISLEEGMRRTWRHMIEPTPDQSLQKSQYPVRELA